MPKTVCYNNLNFLRITGLYMPFIFILFSIALVTPVFADERGSALDNKPSIETTAVPSSQITTPVTTATATTPAAAPVEQQPAGYIYDLKKLIIKSRENIKRVNDKIKEQAVIKRNQKREERAREYYERGLQLTDEGKFDEAREYFEKAVRITDHPEMTGYIKESERRLKLQEQAIQHQSAAALKQEQQEIHSKVEDAETAYREAVALYREKKYKEAKDHFDHVEELVPDYKAVSSYLRIIDQDIIHDEALNAKKQKGEIERQNMEAEAARSREKDVWRKEIERKEKERKDQVGKQAEENYTEAVNLYKTKKFTAAKAKFQEVEWVVPDFKATQNYLKNIDKDIAEEEKRVNIEKQKQLEKQQWEEEVARKKEETQRRAMEEQKEKEHHQQLEEQAQFVYQAALVLYDKRLWEEALEKFNDIEKTLPGYKSTRVYIAKIAQMKERDNTLAQEEAAREARQKALALEKNQREAQEAEQRRLMGEVEGAYVTALDHYRRGELAPAREGFVEINTRFAGYKQTREYVSKIDAKLRDIEEKKRLAETKEEREGRLAKQRDQFEEIKRKTEETQRLYDEGVALYRKKELEAAKEKFIGVVQRYPGFKDTKKYLRELDVETVPIPEPPPAAVSHEPASSPATATREDQIKEAKDIAELAERSSALFKEISGLTNDRYMATTKRKMSQVENVLTNLKEQKERLLRQAREEEERARQEALRRQAELRRAQAGQIYDEAILLLRNKDFDGAKLRFLDLENTSPNFKDTRKYLSRIVQDKDEAEKQAMLEKTHAEERKLKELQEKQRQEELAHQAAEEEQRRQLRQTQEMEMRNLAEKASLLNDDILRLSKERNFEEAKSKFYQLEKVVVSMKSLKEIMEIEDEKKELSKRRVEENIQRQKEQQKAAREDQRGVIVQHQGDEKKVDALRRREVERQREIVFQQAVDLYKQGKYSAAKLIFDDLAAQNDRRARAYSVKIDNAIHREVVKSQRGEEKERGDFIGEHVRRQRQSAILQEKEQIRQRKLTQAMEDQRRLLEDQRQQERMRAESIKFQEKERLLFQSQRRSIDAERKKQEEKFKLRKAKKPQKPKKPEPKVAPVLEPQPEPEPEPEPLPVVVEMKSESEPPPPPSTPEPVLTPKQRRDQIALSNRRKAFFEKKAKEEQRQKAEEQRKKEEEDRKKALEEERKKEIELREQKQKDDAEKAKAKEEEQKTASLKVQEQKAQEEKHRLEVLQKKEEERKQEMERRRQQAEQMERERQENKKKLEQEREEKKKKMEEDRQQKEQEQAKAKEEVRRKAEIDEQARQRKAQLDAERAAIRKQIEDGAESMYKEALELYKQGQYNRAIQKFHDVDEVMPNYKKSRELIKKSVEESIKAQEIPAVKLTPRPMSRSSAVEKALDNLESHGR